MTADIKPKLEFIQYSEKFFTFVELWPRVFLAFPSKEVRGLTVSKAFITILNISKNHIIYRVTKQMTSKVDLRARPFMNVVAPGFQQTIEIIIDSDQTPNIDDKVCVEVVDYDKDTEKSDKKDMEFPTKCTPEFYCYSLYETRKLALIATQEEVFNLQRRLQTLEAEVCNFTEMMASKAWLPSLALLLVIFIMCIASYFWFSKRWFVFNTSQLNCRCGYNLEPSVNLIRNLNWFQKLFIK